MNPAFAQQYNPSAQQFPQQFYGQQFSGPQGFSNNGGNHIFDSLSHWRSCDGGGGGGLKRNPNRYSRSGERVLQAAFRAYIFRWVRGRVGPRVVADRPALGFFLACAHVPSPGVVLVVR